VAPAPQGNGCEGGSHSQGPARESGRGCSLCFRKNRRCPATLRINRRDPTTLWRSTAPSSLPQSIRSSLKLAGSSAYATTPPVQGSFRRCSPPIRKTRKPKPCWNFRRSNFRNEGSTRRLQIRILPVRSPAPTLEPLYRLPRPPLVPQTHSETWKVQGPTRRQPNPYLLPWSSNRHRALVSARLRNPRPDYHRTPCGKERFRHSLTC